MGSDWVGAGSGEMCILHRTVLRASPDGNGYVMVSCDRRCPQHQVRR